MLTDCLSIQRRRAQNRASQRAFRERKEKHVKGLEFQLESLHEKHQDLLQSYTKQVDSIVKLNSKIAHLQTELKTLQYSSSEQQQQPFRHSHSHSHPVAPILLPTTFDAFSFTSDPATMLYDGNSLDVEEQEDMEIPVRSVSGRPRSTKGLPGFEDLLRGKRFLPILLLSIFGKRYPSEGKRLPSRPDECF